MLEIVDFIITQILLLVVGIAIGSVLFTGVFLLTRRMAPSRNRRFALVIAFALPILALFYLEAGILVYEGAGSFFSAGTSDLSLTNGYRLRLWNEDPVTEGVLIFSDGQRVLLGIKGIQVSGDHLFVHAESRESQPGQGPPRVAISSGVLAPQARSARQDQYMEIDTRTAAVTQHSNLEGLRVAALARGASLQLISMEEAIAASPRMSLFSRFVLFTPLLIVGGWLIWRLHQLRGLSDQRATRD